MRGHLSRCGLRALRAQPFLPTKTSLTLFLPSRGRSRGMDSVITKMLTGISPKKSPRKREAGQQQPAVEIAAKRAVFKKCDGERPFRVSIEGNIGAGKSTLLDYFKHLPEIETYSEPIECWRNVRGHNLLELLYTDINKWHMVFQTHVQLTRLKVQTTPPTRPTTTVQMYERSVQNNRFCFVEQAFRSGMIHEADYSILDSWYDWIKSNIDITIDLVVYLRTTPEVVHQRMLDRGRPEEKDIPLDYLKQLHEGHENWLMNGNLKESQLLVLDANSPLDKIIEDYKKHKTRIMGQRTVLGELQTDLVLN